MNFEIYFEIEEFEADKPFYYIKGGSKVRLSKNVFRTFHNILIKICISFLVEMRFSILVHCDIRIVLRICHGEILDGESKSAYEKMKHVHLLQVLTQACLNAL